ncbi:MAG: acyl-CoA desaturase [Arenicella sp.]
MKNKTLTKTIISWFDSSITRADSDIESNEKSVDWLRILPFLVLHLVCFAVIWVGWSPIAVIFAIAFYVIRMFGITAFYHRYFSHKSFKTSRTAQFIFALIGAAATQRGPLWWASHHRHHHTHADKEQDRHSPNDGFLWSHMGWFLSKKNFTTNFDRIKDFSSFPELKWLDRFDITVPIVFALLTFLLGAMLNTLWPELGTSGWQMLVWGYFISTVLLIHGTLTINSLAHVFGHRRFATRDNSKNNFFLALITFGEGWHNNHHRFPSSARQGLHWWEIDFSYYGIWFLEKCGIIWDVKKGPSRAEILKAQQKSNAVV